MPDFLSRCIFTPTAGGLGDFVVSAAVHGYQTPAGANAVDGLTYAYAAELRDSSGNITAWEVGHGVYATLSATLARTTVRFSSNSNSKVDFAAPPNVMITALDNDFYFAQNISGLPAAADLQSGQWGIFKDQSGGNVYLAINDGGTLREVPFSLPFPLSNAVLDFDFANSQYFGGTLVGTLTFSRASTGLARDQAGVLTSFGANTPRITNLGLLMEDIRANSILRSQAFTAAAWTNNNLTITDNKVLAPDNTVTGATLIEDGTVNQHYIIQSFTAPAAPTNYAVSVFAKPLGSDKRFLGIGLQNNGGVGLTQLFYTVTRAPSGTATIGGGAGYSFLGGTDPQDFFFEAEVEYFANGWIRMTTFIQTDGSANQNVALYLSTSPTNVNAYGGSPGHGNGVVLWGAQVEQIGHADFFASSYIPTTNAIVTRAADNAQLALSAGQFTSLNSAGTIFAEWQQSRNVPSANGPNPSGFSGDSGGVIWDLCDTSPPTSSLNLYQTGRALWDANVLGGVAGQAVDCIVPVESASGLFSLNRSVSAWDSSNDTLIQAMNGYLTPISPSRFPLATAAAHLFIGCVSGGGGCVPDGYLRRLAVFTSKESDANILFYSQTQSIQPIVTISPTALNVNVCGYNIALSADYLTASSIAPTPNGDEVLTNVSHLIGKVYYEAAYVTINTPGFSGNGFTSTSLATSALLTNNPNFGVGTLGVVVGSDGNIYYNSGVIGSVGGGNLSNGDVIKTAYDIDSGLVWFKRNAGNWNNNPAANPATGTGGLSAVISPKPVYASVYLDDPSVGTHNVVSVNFAGNPPAGFVNF